MEYGKNKSVPFEISDVNHGLQVVKGLLKLGGGGLELEFEVEDSFVGIFKSGVKKAMISFADLTSVEYRKGWFRSNIVLEGLSMKTFEDVPGTDRATCILKIDRKNKAAAEQLISTARLQLSEYKLNQMGDAD